MTAPYPWLDLPWHRFVAQWSAGRLPHALLLTGPCGLGKRAFAEAISRTVLCRQASGAGVPCGGCDDCRMGAGGHHPDSVRIEPSVEHPSIRVDEIRAIGDFVGHTSHSGGLKIILIFQAERMNINAANSLLKTLEEPPPSNLLILLSEAPSLLPATVRSRCQRWAFQAPPRAQAAAWLQSRIAAGGDPYALLELANGAPLAALALQSEGGLARRQSLFQGYRDALLGKQASARAAQSWGKDEWLEESRWLASWQRDLLRLKLAGGAIRLENPDLASELRTLAGRWTAYKLLKYHDKVMELMALNVTQVNIQLQLESLLMECAADAAH
ncbi:MAG: DNA polymerase III subunit delta' [Gammaproteobacteria bacterium]